jgi:predicted Zn finger-like uncharacterized protein
MILTCEKCQTRFYLDEKKIKSPTAKVRCSRCQHVFPVSTEPVQEPDLSSFLLSDDEPVQEEAAQPPFSPAPPISDSGPDNQIDLSVQESAFLPLEKPAASARSRLWLWITSGCLIIFILLASLWWFKIFPFRKPVSPAKVAEKKKEAPPVSQPPSGPSPAVSRSEAIPAEQNVQHLRIVSHEGLYIGLENVKGGNLLVLRGTVENVGSQSCGPIRIQATLSDSEHKQVKQRIFFAGVNFSADELSNLEPDQINQRLDKPSSDPAAQMLAPGKTGQFVVVFFGVPKNLAGYVYDLKIVSAPVVN